MRYFPSFLTCFVVAVTMATVPLAGCGGGKSTAPVSERAGRAVVSVTFPPNPVPDSRVVPLATCSIRVRLTRQSGEVVGERLLTRPDNNHFNGGTASTIFNDLPTEEIQVRADAFPELDGTGVMQATGATVVAVVAGDNPPLRLRLDSTVTEISLPETFVIPAGETRPLPVTARNAAGEIVLESPLAYDVVSDNLNVAAPVYGLNTRARRVGSAVLRVVSKEHALSASTTVRTTRTAEYTVRGVELGWTRGYDTCRVSGINNTGVFVGWCRKGSDTAPTAVRGFVSEKIPLSLAREEYRLVELGTVGSHDLVYPLGINDSGVIVGTAYDAGGSYRAFRRDTQSGEMSVLAGLPDTDSSAEAINSSGTIVGSYRVGGAYTLRPFRHANGVATPIETGANFSGMVQDMNDAGQVVGQRSRPELDITSPTLWRDRTPLYAPESVFLRRINNRGQMISFRYVSAAMPSVPVFWGEGFSSRTEGQTVAAWGNQWIVSDINDDGVVVGAAGVSGAPPETRRAVLWRDAQVYDLQTLLPPGDVWVLRSADAINYAGVIVGSGNEKGSAGRFYVAVPQGE
ncbi:MAG: hypothetical protein H7Y38_13885 [Armatimonadetes bacterium]|nr:hypothetical protein [Armatimonadota bacterium]